MSEELLQNGCQCDATTAESDPRDRRQTQRVDATEYRVWVSWKENGELVTHAAQINDISMGGISVMLDTMPPQDSTLWVRLDSDPARIDSASAKVVSLTTLGLWNYKVGLAWCGRA